MDTVAALVAGLAGTAAMTGLLYLMPLLGLAGMDITGILGTLFTTKKGVSRLLGVAMHFIVGTIFAIAYAFLWSRVLGDPTWLWGLIFGFVHGAIFLVGLPMMMGMHPRAPHIPMGPLLATAAVVGHMIYGLVVALVYAALAG